MTILAMMYVVGILTAPVALTGTWNGMLSGWLLPAQGGCTQVDYNVYYAEAW